MDCSKIILQKRAYLPWSLFNIHKINVLYLLFPFCLLIMWSHSLFLLPLRGCQVNIVSGKIMTSHTHNTRKYVPCLCALCSSSCCIDIIAPVGSCCQTSQQGWAGGGAWQPNSLQEGALPGYGVLYLHSESTDTQTDHTSMDMFPCMSWSELNRKKGELAGSPDISEEIGI